MTAAASDRRVCVRDGRPATAGKALIDATTEDLVCEVACNLPTGVSGIRVTA